MARLARSLVCLCAIVSGAAHAQSTVAVDTAVHYQTMTGWEVTARSWEIDKIGDRYDPTWAENADLVAQHMVDELGINRVRLEITSGAENPTDYWSRFVSGAMTYNEYKAHSYDNINDDSDPNHANAAGFQFARIDFYMDTVVTPMRERLEARGEHLYVNLILVDFNTGEQGSLDIGRAPDEYAELILVHLDHLRDAYALVPDSLEITLEPENTQHFRGTEIGRSIAAVSARMRAGGYDIDIVAPSNANPANTVSYLGSMAAVTDGLRDVTTIAFHRYGTADFGAIWSAASARGMQTAMLEHIDGTIEQLYEDLTVANVSAWQKWAIGVRQLDNFHYYYQVDLSDPAAPVIRMDPGTSMLAQYFRYVRLGAMRVSASTADASLQPVAFVNPNGQVVVVIKTSSGTTARDAIITGLPDGAYGVRRTDYASRATDLADADAIGGSLMVHIQAGVTTVYGRTGAIVVPDAGVPPARDGGSTADAGSEAPGEDAAVTDLDGGSPVRDAGSGAVVGGCGCRASTRSDPSPLWILAVIASIAMRRGRPARRAR